MRDVDASRVQPLTRGAQRAAVAGQPGWESLHDPPHCVGRGSELAFAQALIHEATLALGSVVLFVGESGVGKTRLLAECCRLCASAVTLSLRVRATPTFGGDVLTQLADALRIPGDRLTATLMSSVQAAIVEKAKRNTILLLVDDIHRADDRDVAVLGSLMHLTRRRRIAFVGCMSDEPPFTASSAPPRIVRRFDFAPQLRLLQPIERAPMELLVRGLVKDISGTVADDVVVREIVDAAEGNPRFAIELATNAAQAPSAASLIPASAHAIADIACEAMSKSAFEIIMACSVVGREFDERWMIEILRAPRGAIAEALQSGADLGLLVEQAESPGCFSFRREAVRRALSSRLVTLKRQMLHERAAMCLTELPTDPGHASLMAPHWDALADHDLAAERLTRAATDIEAKGVFAVAADLYARATSHVEHGSQSWRSLIRRLVHCYERLGQWEKMIPRLLSLLSTFEPRSDAELVGEILSDLQIAYLNDGDREAARRVAADLATRCLSERHYIAVCGLALNLFHAGRLEDARRLLGQYDQDATLSEESRLHSLIAWAKIGCLHEPLEVTLGRVEQALEIGRRRRKVGFCCDVAAEIALCSGSLDRARPYVDAAIEAAARGSGVVTKHMARHKQISLHYLEGDLAAAQRELTSLLEWRASGAHNESFRAGLGVLIGMRVADLALVDALFDPALLDRAISKGDADSCGVLLPAFAEVMQARGMDEELHRAIRRCIEGCLVDPYLWIQMTAARFGPRECVQPAAQQMEAFLHEAVAAVAPAHAAYFYALAARQNGHRAAATAHGLDAAARYRRVGWRLWEASAFEAAGEWTRASTIYDRCGAHADVARIAAGRKRRHVRAPFGGHLTPRELEVARLLVRKWTNNDIARALKISVRTVDHHVEAVFGKVGVNSRWQLNEALLDGIASR